MIGFALSLAFPALLIAAAGIAWIISRRPERTEDEPEEVHRIRLDCK